MYKKTETALLALLMLCTATSLVANETPTPPLEVNVLLGVVDPTRPSDWLKPKASAAKAAPVAKTPRVSFIKYSDKPQSRQVLINGKMLSTGDRAGDYRISQIQKDRVVFTRHNKRIEVALNNSDRRIHIKKTTPRQ